MQNTKQVLVELAKKAQNSEYKFRRIYRYLCNPEIYKIAYSKIYNNKGSSATEVNSKTADSFNKLIENIINELKDESYKCQPLRRVATAKKRILTLKDSLIQEACKMILETIYEPIFTPYSHGYRESMNCHTALTQIQRTFTDVNWFIESGIKGCFDNIDHHVLTDLMRRRIEDERFIRLIWKMLKSGHLENFVYHNTHGGIPQGGIISPLLANIYLHELDIFITKTNCHYVRYADDIIIGVSGNLELANKLRNNIKEFTKNELKLELSEEKILIRHSSKGVKFLNYDIRARDFKAVDRSEHRCDNRRIVLGVPQEVIIWHINDKKIIKDINAAQWRGKARSHLQNLSDLEIITIYNAEIKGLYDYYCLAENVSSKMHTFYHAMEYSCLKTLAGKHKSSVSQIRDKYKIGENWGIKYQTAKGEKIRYFYKDGFYTKANLYYNGEPYTSRDVRAVR